MATYRRSARRRTRYSASRGQEGQGGTAGRVLLGLLAVAAILYFITASVAGSWLSENIVNPVMEAFNPEPEQAALPALTPYGEPDALSVPAAVPGGMIDPISAPLPADENEPVSAGAPAAAGTDFKLEGAGFYAVQMGAFKSEANAGTEADAVRQRGGAGYVYFDGELYRVLASAYATEAEAKDVRDQLKEDMIESGVFPIEIREVDLRVTAGQNVVSAMTGAVDAIKKAREDMTALSIAFDKEEKTQEQAGEEVSAIGAELKAALDTLKKEAGSDNAVISSLSGAMEKMIGDLNQLASVSGGSSVDFSSRMKYTQIGIISDTVEFIEEITA